MVYIGSRCEQIEAEYTQTKEYLNSELKKANDQTEAVRQEKVASYYTGLVAGFVMHFPGFYFFP